MITKVCDGVAQVFELASVVDQDALVHYPVAEIVSRSKLSCVVWNSYLKTSLLAADYDGGLQMWDVATRAPVACWYQHSHRVWSTDYSQVGQKVQNQFRNLKFKFFEISWQNCPAPVSPLGESREDLGNRFSQVGHKAAPVFPLGEFREDLGRLCLPGGANN